MVVRTHRRHRGETGQALIETAIVLILLLTVFMGVYATSTFASDQNSATTAVRSGARLGAELGNKQYPANGDNPSLTGINAVDLQIVSTVCQLAKQMPFVSSIDEVDVYRPGARPDGSLGAGDLVDKYNCTSNLLLNPPYQYGLSLRRQDHPNETLLGVKLAYHYHAPTPLISVTAATSRYAVMSLEPQF